jgi:hypothetical protein
MKFSSAITLLCSASFLASGAATVIEDHVEPINDVHRRDATAVADLVNQFVSCTTSAVECAACEVSLHKKQRCGAIVANAPYGQYYSLRKTQ